MTPRRPKRRKPSPRPDQPPWRLASSLRAGLPQSRAEWLAIVLPAIDAAKTHPRCADVLADAGYLIDCERPGATVALWWRWLDAEQRAGRLPEHAAPFPARTPGFQVGDAPLPTSVVGRHLAEVGDGGTRAERVMEHLRANGRAHIVDIASAVYGADASRAPCRIVLCRLAARGEIQHVSRGVYEVTT